MSNAYAIEIRDLNGSRETLMFHTSSDALQWCLSISDEEAEEIEILVVIQIINGKIPCTLYSGLGQTVPLTVDDLGSFLS